MPAGLLRAALVRAIAALQNVVQVLDAAQDEAVALDQAAEDFELVVQAVDEPEPVPVGDRALLLVPAPPLRRPRPAAPGWNERCAYARAVGAYALSQLRGAAGVELERPPPGIPASRFYLLLRNSVGHVYSPARAYQRRGDLDRELEKYQGDCEPLYYSFASQREVEAFSKGSKLTIAFNRFQ